MGHETVSRATGLDIECVASLGLKVITSYRQKQTRLNVARHERQGFNLGKLAGSNSNCTYIPNSGRTLVVESS